MEKFLWLLRWNVCLFLLKFTAFLVTINYIPFPFFFPLLAPFMHPALKMTVSFLCCFYIHSYMHTCMHTWVCLHKYLYATCWVCFCFSFFCISFFVLDNQSEGSLLKMKTTSFIIDKFFMCQSEKEAFVKSSVSSWFGNGGSAGRCLAELQ